METEDFERALGAAQRLARDYLDGLRENHFVLVTGKTPKKTKSADVKFFERLCKYLVLRRVGTIQGYYGPTENGVIFQS